jgi:voltage-dependent potassium channel beta subunit
VQYRRVGRSGLRVSEIGLGSWLTYGRSVGQSTTDEIVRRALDHGITFFDTADVYAKGAAEIALGQALQGVSRSDVVVATKCFWPMTENPNDRGLSRKHIIESCEKSLDRLDTDYLDILQCHRYDPDTPVDEVVRAMHTLVEQGKILYWGVSVWTAEQILDACRHADRLGLHRPISNQPQYNLLYRSIEAEVIPVSTREGVGQVVWSPLAGGALTGKYAGGKRPAGSRGADEKVGKFIDGFLTEETLPRIDRLVAVARERELTPVQLALGWCLRQPTVSSVIVGATSVSQLDENVTASGVTLDQTTLSELDELFPLRSEAPA